MKEGSVSTAASKKPVQAPPVPAGPSGRGGVQPVRLSDNQRKPGHSDEVASSNDPEIPSDKKMDETRLLSDDDLLLPGAQSLSSGSGETTEWQKDNARKKKIFLKFYPT